MENAFLLAALTSVAMASLLGIGFVWLVRFRRSVMKVLQENALQQIKLAEKMGDALTHVQKQQTTYEQYVKRIAEAHLALKQDFNTVLTRLEKSDLNDLISKDPHILH